MSIKWANDRGAVHLMSNVANCPLSVLTLNVPWALKSTSTNYKFTLSVLNQLI